MVQSQKARLSGSSQNQLADKQENTSDGQFVEALHLLSTVEDSSGSGGPGSGGTSLERGGLNGVLGTSNLDAGSGRLGGQGASRSSRGARRSALVDDRASQRDGEPETCRGSPLGVACGGVRAGHGLGLSLSGSARGDDGQGDLGTSSSGRGGGRTSAGWRDAEGQGGLLATTRLSLGLGGGNIRSLSRLERDSNASHLSWSGRDLGGAAGLN